MPALWLSRRFAPAVVVSLASSTFAVAQNESKAPPAPTDQPAATAPADAPQVDPFQIPEGNDPQVLQKFLERLFQTPPANRSLSGRQEHLRKVEAVVARLQQKDLDEATALTSSDMRFQILQFLERSGDPTAAADRQKFIEALSKHKLPKVAERGTLYGLASRVSGMAGLKPDARQKLIDDIAAYIGAGEVTEERYSLASQTPELLAQIGDNELASKALEAFAKAFESRKDDRVADLVAQLRATGRRYGLVGKPMKVEGTTIDGKPFNVTSLKGKVVLVDFWATWCGPCLEELPHVQDLYNAYNKKGFEVVGVSLDQEKDVLQAFLAEKKLPWVQLYAEAQGDGGWSNPIAKHYGISAIPTAILIGKDGNVVSLNATGRELTGLLEKLLGPADAPKEEAPKSE